VLASEPPEFKGLINCVLPGSGCGFRRHSTNIAVYYYYYYYLDVALSGYRTNVHPAVIESPNGVRPSRAIAPFLNSVLEPNCKRKNQGRERWEFSVVLKLTGQII